MKKYSLKKATSAILATASLLTAGLCGTAQGAVTITSGVNFDAGTGNFTYSYNVANLPGSPEDLVLISIPVDPISGVSAISTPIGFTLDFDPSQGWVNLMEDGSIITPQTFAPGSITGPFSFISKFGPAIVSYSAFDAAGTEYTGLVQSPVPEPSGMLLLGLALAGPALIRRRQTL